jgi:carbon-monoxide dehydrogenase large subunit
MFEEAVYDEHGQLITGELMDYAIPRAESMPWMETHRTVTPSPVNPLGLKGVGEAGTIGATPAIINAVVDALAPFGVRHVDMPVKRERIWKLMHAAPPKRATQPSSKAKSKPKPKPKAKTKPAARSKSRRRAR